MATRWQHATLLVLAISSLMLSYTAALADRLSFKQAASSFAGLPIDTRYEIQMLLIAAGYSNAVSTETFSTRIYDSISRFQNENSFIADGRLTADELLKLKQLANPVLSRWQLSLVSQPESNFPLWVPMGLKLTAKRDGDWLIFSTPDSSLVVQLFRSTRMNIRTTFRAIKSSLNSRGLPVGYNVLKPDFFVITAGNSSTRSYTRFHAGRSDVTGFSLLFSPQEHPFGDRLSTLMSDLFRSAAHGQFRSPPPALVGVQDSGAFKFDRQALLQKLRTTVPGMEAMKPQLVKVPTVPCPATTMTSDEPPPNLPSEIELRIEPTLRDEVSFYKAATMQGVVGPRGWTCKGYSGSSGRSIVLAPDGEGLGPAEDYVGPRVVLSVSYGETSGRFAVAGISGNLFPSVANFVEDVRSEGIGAPPKGPFKHDTYYYLSPTVVVFRTAPNEEGVGTRNSKPTAMEVMGVARLSGIKSAPNLHLLTIRLPSGSDSISRAILFQSISGKGG